MPFVLVYFLIGKQLQTAALNSPASLSIHEFELQFLQIQAFEIYSRVCRIQDLAVFFYYLFLETFTEDVILDRGDVWKLSSRFSTGIYFKSNKSSV